jgi:hypothetical protein
MSKGMIIDPDHMSVIARKHTLDLLEANRYSGTVSSHSWSELPSYARILKLGGVVTPMADSTEEFAHQWRRLRPLRSGKHLYGLGYGDDMNGFAAKSGPREGNEKNPVVYPFKSFDGGTTLERNRARKRVWDINKDGMDQFGLFPDWVEDLRIVTGDDQIIRDLSLGTEAYLQMWERANGVPGPGCRPRRSAFTRAGLSAVRIGDTPEALLRRAGQPGRRLGRSFRYCVQGRANARGRVVAAFTPSGIVGLVASTARHHSAGGIRPGASVRRLRGRARAFGRGIYVRPAGPGRARLVYGVRGGKVRYVGVASRPAAATPERLRRYLRLTRLG